MNDQVKTEDLNNFMRRKGGTDFIKILKLETKS